MTDRHWWPRKHPALESRQLAPAPGPEPGSPPPGHTQWTSPHCGTAQPCVIEYGPDGEITRRWSCMVSHFPSRPL